jgi:putative membrane-bound dehydrogenase-like protein
MPAPAVNSWTSFAIADPGDKSPVHRDFPELPASHFFVVKKEADRLNGRVILFQVCCNAASMKLFNSWVVCMAIFPAVLPAPGAEVRLDSHTFTIPDGFVIERIAGAPLVNRPIEADFDEAGRLYVTDSSGSNEKVQVQLETKPHRIVRLEDSDGDGVFDRSVVFADRMMFPEGALWHDGSLYVSAPPSIWRLTDTDGDGVADQRDEWFQGNTLTGCANDLHGPYLGLDGRIYWSKGAFASQTYERPGAEPWVTRAAHLFRARTDGTDIEPVMTGGMDNPVGITFLPSGERVFTTTFFQHPGGGKRDGLIHAIYGGVYGKVHDVIEGHPRTGDLLPVLSHFGPAAPCGILTYASDRFGAGFQGDLFACQFNLHKISRTELEPAGATFHARDSDFLVSDNTDFHPTDVLEDADGSLVVINTGGWYKLCCPTSQLPKPDVLGAIYRVRPARGAAVSDPRGLALGWDSMDPVALAGLLGDKRPAVRNRATALLTKRGESAVEAVGAVLVSSAPPLSRLQAVWALTRIDGSGARTPVRLALRDSDATVRHAAAHSAGLWRDREAVSALVLLLEDPSNALRRVAAEALGRIGDRTVAGALVQAAGRTDDRILEHSLIYALIELGDSVSVAALVNDPAIPARSRRACLIALDQIAGGSLQAGQVTPLLGSRVAVLRETALWIVDHHPNWAGALAGFVEGQLRRDDLNAEDVGELHRMIGQFSADPEIQRILNSAAGGGSAGRMRLAALDAMAGAGLKNPPASWVATVTGLLGKHDVELISRAVAIARSWSATRDADAALITALERTARNRELPDPVRLDALASVPGGLAEVDADQFKFLSERVAPEQTVAVRTTAARVLARSKLTGEQLQALTKTLRTAGPLEVPILVEAYAQNNQEKLGLELVSALEDSHGLFALQAYQVKQALARYPESVRNRADALLASRNTDAAAQRAKIERLEKGLADGDVRRGQAVFNSARAACASCHAIGYLGGNLGPDLTRIGQIRNERDLLEAIVYPSASFVRSYEPMIVETTGGGEYSGVLRRDAADEIVLATGPGLEMALARSEIAEMRPGTSSLMPGGLDEQLSPQELADLVTFLRANR